jgi:hypothetical protein
MAEGQKSGDQVNQPTVEGETVGEVVEGGYVGPLDDYRYIIRRREDTARRLAYILVVILGGSFALHYGATLFLQSTGRANAAESLTPIFNAWLPVIASLAGSAVTYFFTKEKN